MLTEKTLDQILGVLELTRKYYQSGVPVSKAYHRAVKDIAHKYSVRYQTIADGCRRRLNLDNVNEFMELLKEWLGGDSRRLKDLLIKNIENLDEYKVENFFSNNVGAPSTISSLERKVDEPVEGITFKVSKNIGIQLRALAEAEGKNIQELMTTITKEYLNLHYVEYLKNLINSLPPDHKKQVIAELSNSLKQQ